MRGGSVSVRLPLPLAWMCEIATASGVGTLSVGPSSVAGVPALSRVSERGDHRVASDSCVVGNISLCFEQGRLNHSKRRMRICSDTMYSGERTKCV